MKAKSIPVGVGKFLRNLPADFVEDTWTGDIITLSTGEVIPMSEFLEWNHSRDPEMDLEADIALSGTPPSFVEGIDNLCDEFLALTSPETFLVGPDLCPDEEIGETDTGHWFTPIRVRNGLAFESLQDRYFVHGAGSENKIHPHFAERITIHPKEIPGWQSFGASVIEILKDLKSSVNFEQLSVPPFALLSEIIDIVRARVASIMVLNPEGDLFDLTQDSFGTLDYQSWTIPNQDLLSLLQGNAQEIAELEQENASLRKQLRKIRCAKFGHQNFPQSRKRHG